MMTWWRNVERATEMPGAFHWLILGFIAAAALLSYLQPAEQLRIRTASIFFGLAVAGLVTAGAIFPTSATPGTVISRCAALLCSYWQSPLSTWSASLFSEKLTLHILEMAATKVVPVLLTMI
jgi:hypothetical protein